MHVVGGFDAPSGIAGSQDVYFGDASSDAFHILDFQVPTTSLAESLVGFACPVASRESRIGGESFEIARHHVLDSLASAHQGYQHEDAPKDAERSQETPRLVSGNGDENLFPSVYVYSE